MKESSVIPDDILIQAAAISEGESEGFAWGFIAAWMQQHERERILKIIGEACDKDCLCGGAGPGEGCDVCNFYHKIFDAIKGTDR